MVGQSLVASPGAVSLRSSWWPRHRQRCPFLLISCELMRESALDLVSALSLRSLGRTRNLGTNFLDNPCSLILPHTSLYCMYFLGVI